MNSYMERVICRAVIVDLQLSIVNCQLSIVNFMKKFLPDLIAILAFIILSFAYFFPADIEGRILFQHDTVAGVGAGQEAQEYLERTGERTRDKLSFWWHAYLSDVSEL